MDISKRATTLSQHGEDKRYAKAVKAHPYLEQLPMPTVTMVVGSSGSRKTSFMLSLLKDLQESSRYFDIIILYSGAKDNNEQYETFKKGKTEVKCLNDYNEAEFNTFIRTFESENMKRKEENRKMVNCAVIFDDPVGLPGWRMGTSLNPSSVDRLCTTCRHFNMSLFYLVQRYRLMNMVMRCTNLTALVLMALKPKELTQVAEEHSFDLCGEDDFEQIYHHIRKGGESDFMVVNYKVPKQFRIQHNFKPIPLDIETANLEVPPQFLSSESSTSSSASSSSSRPRVKIPAKDSSKPK